MVWDNKVGKLIYDNECYLTKNLQGVGFEPTSTEYKWS